jgi:glutamate-1-semialdehyde aminotransferase
MYPRNSRGVTAEAPALVTTTPASEASTDSANYPAQFAQLAHMVLSYLPYIFFNGSWGSHRAGHGKPAVESMYPISLNVCTALKRSSHTGTYSSTTDEQLHPSVRLVTIIFVRSGTSTLLLRMSRVCTKADCLLLANCHLQQHLLRTICQAAQTTAWLSSSLIPTPCSTAQALTMTASAPFALCICP